MSRAVGRGSLDNPKFGGESLDIGRKSLKIPKLGQKSLDMGRKSLDIPKFGRESLDMSQKSLDTGSREPCPDFGDQTLVYPDFRYTCPDFRNQILVCPDFRGPRRDSCPDFPDSKSRRAQLCNLGLNPDVARTLKSGHESGTSTLDNEKNRYNHSR